MTHEELEDAVPLYAVGALERIERQALDAHLLSGCVTCHTALKDYQSAVGLLPFGLEITAPPRSLKAKIMAAKSPAASTESVPQHPVAPSLPPGKWMNHLFPPETAHRRLPLGGVWTWAILAILIAGGYEAWDAYMRTSADTAKLAQLQAHTEKATADLAAIKQQLSQREQSLAEVQEALQRRTSELAELKDQLNQQESDLEELQTQLVQRGGRLAPSPQHELAALLRLPNAKVIALPGTAHAKQASGILLYDERTQKMWLYAVNLPDCPSGTTYQLWAMHDTPVSVGIFHPRRGASAHLFVNALPDFLEIKQFALSLEPQGGRPEPTGPLFLESPL
jgi:Anti-sigma-K factor rskA